MKHYRELQTKVDLFFNEKLEKPGDGKGLSYYQYVSLLNEPDVSERIALTLMDKFDYLKKTSIKELATYVKKADKDLALKLKDGTITLDQLKARIAERKTGLKYVVLDDLKDILDPKFYAEVYQEESKNV